MRLVILRHGRAKDRTGWLAPDAMRPLTGEGRRRTRQVTEAVAPLVRGLSAIYSSPWLRATQTADIAAKAWDLEVEEHHWLAGEGFSARDRIDRLPHADIALVGHEPDLGELIGLLTGGPAIPLKKAGLAILSGQPFDGGMRLELLLTPAAVLALQ
jgi:phosphohistidine phosphatase